MWLSKYMSRVEGLGDVQALFYPHARSEEDARGVRRYAAATDARRRYRELFRIEELNIRDEGRGLLGPNWYLLTGVPSTKRPVDMFFVAPSDGAARQLALERQWDNARLYRCEECAQS
jgi:hypothetical protein